MIIILFCLIYHFPAHSQMVPLVEAEEDICEYTAPGNGAGPLWCYGAPVLVRAGERVFVPVMETGEGVPPLCNTRWKLYCRDDSGWRVLHEEREYRQREPCPLMMYRDGRLFLSVNTSLTPPGTQYRACLPHVLEFDSANPAAQYKTLVPRWEDGTYFTDHSYRGCAVDAERGELLLLNINAETGTYFWSLLDSENRWSRQGIFSFPIRSCYPQVVLKDRAAHVLAIGDIVEPVEEWRQYKFEHLQRQWDYVFRRLYYARNPDVGSASFGEPLEIASLEETAGHITNLDLWIDEGGTVHVLYLARSVQYEFLRDKFFPGVPFTTSLEYCAIQNGVIKDRKTLLSGGEGISPEIPGFGRFHATRDKKLYVVYHCGGTTPSGNAISENRILRVLPADDDTAPVTIPLEKPFTRFFTATERGGNIASDIIDLYGTGEREGVLQYAMVRLSGK